MSPLCRAKRPPLLAAIAISALVLLVTPAQAFYDAATVDALKTWGDEKFKNTTLSTIESLASLLNATKAAEKGEFDAPNTCGNVSRGSHGSNETSRSRDRSGVPTLRWPFFSLSRARCKEARCALFVRSFFLLDHLKTFFFFLRKFPSSTKTTRQP